ncbi:MAG TPA: hypothetical protein VHD87_00760 [Acidimicrobiales bacterium]|nr:hypothetical protein [Acidimicrobiales bacterium]
MRRAALVVAATLALVWVGAPVTRAKQSSTLPLTALRAVLKVRSDAQRDKNRDAYAATIDPQAPATFRDAQLKSFDGLASLPVARINYSIGAQEVDLTRGVDRSKYANAPVALVATTRALRFTYDARSSLDSMFWTFVKRGTQWYVGGDDDVADLGLETNVSMWDTGPVVVEQSAHFQLIAHPDQAARANELLGLEENALTTLDGRWRLPWSEKLVGFVPSSPDELSDLIQASVDVTKFVAFVAYGYNPDTLKGAVPRLYVQDRNLSRYPAADQTETLVHEFTHAAGSAYASSFIPSWIHEGLAEWIRGGPQSRDPRSPGAGDHAPRDDQFGAGTQGQIVQAYRDAQSLIATLSRVAGANSPFDLFVDLGQDKVRPGAQSYVVDQELTHVGVSGGLAGLENDWVGGR